MNKRVCILKSKKNWKIIDKEIKKLNWNKGFNLYLSNRLQMLKEDYEKNPESVISLINDIKTQKQQRQYCVPPYKDFSFLNDIQAKTNNTPISAIVDIIILDPLLTFR